MSIILKAHVIFFLGLFLNMHWTLGNRFFRKGTANGNYSWTAPDCQLIINALCTLRLASVSAVCRQTASWSYCTLDRCVYASDSDITEPDKCSKRARGLGKIARQINVTADCAAFFLLFFLG